MKTQIWYFLMILILLGSFSCSGNRNPITSGSDQFSGLDPKTNERDPGKDISTQTLNPYRNVFGTWKVHIDRETLIAEIEPSRNAHAIGHVFDSDLSQFLFVNPCSNCLSIRNITMDRWSDLHISFVMKHPFGNIDSRPDLHGFDVRLIFILPSNTDDYSSIKVIPPGGTEEPASIASYFLMNPDGFTSHYDSLVTDERYFIGGEDIPGNLNPFLRFFEDYQATQFDPHNPSGHNVMPVGSGNDVKTAIFTGYLIYEESLDLYAVADVAYGQSATFANRLDPQYYLPAFNRTEAWRVEYWIENNNLDADDPASSADIVVQVFDWQQGASVDPDYPNPANLSGIPVKSDVKQVELQLPYLQDDVITLTTPESGAGTPSDPLQYRFHVNNINSGDGVTSGLLAVRDDLCGQPGRLPVPESPAGFPYETQDILDYAFYTIIRVNVPYRPSGEVTYNEELWVEGETQYTAGSSTSIIAHFFMDPSMSRFKYEWDYDYDGVTFDVDGEGMPSPEIEFANTGVNHVGLKVTTNSVPPREYIYDIPVYVKGSGFETILDTAGNQLDATYLSDNQAVAMTDDHLYIAYTSESSGKREVWLAVGDEDGNFISSSIASNPLEECYNPSMVVVNDGVHDGIYVLFNQDNTIHNADLYSTWGNLDGTGFGQANIRAVNAGTMSVAEKACLIYRDGSLYAYYKYWSGLGGTDIDISYSENMGDSWTYYGHVNETTDGTQTSPAAYYADDWGLKKVYVVWEDSRDFANRGIDLYIARSSNMLDFDPEINISTFPDDTIEVSPSITKYNYQLGVAYLALNPSTSEQNVYLKLISPSDLSSRCDYKIDTTLSGYRHTYPAVATSSYGRFLVAYGICNNTTNEMKMYVAEVQTDSHYTSWYDNKIYEIDAGTLSSPDPTLYPGLASRAVASDEATESLLVFTNYLNGVTERTDPFTMYLGDIQVVQIISDCVDTYP